MHIHRRIQVDCGDAALWRCLTEPALLKEWISQFVEERPDDATRSGVGAGSTICMREGGKLVNYRCIVTEWMPKQRVAVRISGGSLGTGNKIDVRYELSPGDMAGTTALEYDLQMPFNGLLFKLMSPLIWLMSVRNLKRDLARLARLAPTVSA